MSRRPRRTPRLLALAWRWVLLVVAWLAPFTVCLALSAAAAQTAVPSTEDRDASEPAPPAEASSDLGDSVPDAAEDDAPLVMPTEVRRPNEPRFTVAPYRADEVAGPVSPGPSVLTRPPA